MTIKWLVFTCPSTAHRLPDITYKWVPLAPPGSVGYVTDDIPGYVGGYYNQTDKYWWLFTETECPADWVCFVDDDSWVYPSRFRWFLENTEQRNPGQKLAVGHIAEWGASWQRPGPLDTRKRWRWHTGVGFTINRAAWNAIRDDCKRLGKEGMPWTKFADVSLGLWLNVAGAKLIDAKDYFNITNHVALGHSKTYRKTALVYHYVKPEHVPLLLAEAP